MISEDINFVKSVLPSTYEVKESKDKGSVHCISPTGIVKPPYLNNSTGRIIEDAEDDEHWSYILGSFRQHFGERFLEVFHNVCFCHTNFTVYLR